jgi:hypothetical protein
MTNRRFAAILAGVLLSTAGCGTSQPTEQPSAAVTSQSSPASLPTISETPSASPAEAASPAAMPASKAPATIRGASPTPAKAKPKPTTAPAVYYANCAAAKAAGVAPLYRGDPGYRSGLDRDGDGVACEK